MYGLTAFDATRAALQQSAYQLQAQDDAALVRVTYELLQLYEGNQKPGVWRYIEGHVQNAELRKRYKSLATFMNVIRLLVDRVSTLGELPVRVVWHDEEGEPYINAQKQWDEVTAHRMGEATWNTSVPAIARDTELTKTCVAAVTWDEDEKRICLDRYTPNQLRVGYSRGLQRQRRPDQWYILKHEATDLWQAWDLSQSVGVVYDVDQELKKRADEAIPYPVFDPKTQRSAVPFVAFRTCLPRDGYFAWDGQYELLEAQEFLNKTLTQLAHQLHYGAFRMPIMEGPGWVDGDGQTKAIVLDPSVALVCPASPLGDQRGTIRFDGPSAEDTIRVLLEALNHSLETAAATFGVNASAIRAKNEATSGYALQIESAALRSRHARTRTLAQHPLERLVELIRWTWDTYNPSEKFPADALFDVVIPDYGSGVTTREETDADLAKLKAGVVSRRTLILKYNPGISSEEVAALLDDSEEAEDLAESATLVELVKAGVLTRDEAREELDYPPLPEKPAPEPPTVPPSPPGGAMPGQPMPMNMGNDSPGPVTPEMNAEAAVPPEAMNE